LNYAKHECYDCHIIKPANEMMRWRSSEPSSSYRRAGTVLPTTVRDRWVDRWVCKPCAGKRRRRRALVFLLLVAAVAGWIVYHKLSDGPAPSTSTAASHQDEGSPADVKPEKETPKAAPVSGPETSAQSEPPDPKVEAAAISTVTPQNDSNLSAAVQAALTSGNPTTWQDAGSSGSTSVSSPQSYGSKECRSYRYTVIRDGQTWNSPDGLACRQDGGDWDLEAKVPG
jgi:hypothetical protein